VKHLEDVCATLLGAIFIGIPMLIFFALLLFVPIGIIRLIIQGHP
jgi:hypothetical protein